MRCLNGSTLASHHGARVEYWPQCTGVKNAKEAYLDGMKNTEKKAQNPGSPFLPSCTKDLTSFSSSVLPQSEILEKEKEDLEREMGEMKRKWKEEKQEME
ncbi:hypothetical protein AAC387_Pa12g2054 [Persea americana]